MGANATTFVPAYVSGEVLTAADLTVTNSGIPVFADSTARDAAFGGTGEKVLAEGQYAYLESTNATQFFDGAAWQPVGVAPGLILVSSTTIGTTVASVTISGAFSSTYDNYKILISGGTVSGGETDLQLTLGAQVTGYKTQQSIYSYNTSAPGYLAPTTNIPIGRADTDGLTADASVVSPNLAKHTFVTSACGSDTFATTVFATSNSNTQFTAFTVTIGTGTMTGGTVRVYGYANS